MREILWAVCADVLQIGYRKIPLTPVKNPPH